MSKQGCRLFGRPGNPRRSLLAAPIPDMVWPFAVPEARTGVWMKSAFRGYYPPTEDELEVLWTEGLLVLDTNALLNLFRYTANTRQEFLDVLTNRLADLWIPHHVGVEFHRRRLDVIYEQRDAFSAILKSIETASSSVAGQIQTYRRHPSLDANDLLKQVTDHFEAMKELVSSATEQYDNSGLEQEDTDTFESVSALFDQRVGQPWGEEKLGKLYLRGAERFDRKVPPGYEDAKKPEPDRYGDLVIWEQLLEHARAVRKSAIFITDDSKQDWWHIKRGKTLGPRPELVDEYFAASGQRIHFYPPDRFLSFAKERGLIVSDESLSEIQAVSVVRRERSQELAAKEFADRGAQRARSIDALGELLRSREVLAMRIRETRSRIARTRRELSLAEYEVERFSRLDPLDTELTAAELIRHRTELGALKERLEVTLVELASLETEESHLEAEASTQLALELADEGVVDEETLSRAIWLVRRMQGGDSPPAPA